MCIHFYKDKIAVDQDGEVETSWADPFPWTHQNDSYI